MLYTMVAKAARDLFIKAINIIADQSHMQINILYSKLLLFFLIFGLLTGCKNNKQPEFSSPPGYNLNKPQVVKLAEMLNEISGIVYYPKDTSVFAIVDERGILFKIFMREKPEVQHWNFGKSSDYEDLVLLDSVFYALKSKGNIVAFKFSTPDSLTTEEYDIPASGKNEFESLYYDSSINKLVLLCKECEADKKKQVSSWSFDPVEKSYDEGPYVLDSETILGNIHKTKEKKLKPSAANIHPLTGDLYIISSVNKALIIADRKGKVKAVYELDPKLYKQPEGISFTPEGVMLISNEAANVGLPELLVFKNNGNNEN